jgi:hypothetical protein
MKIINGFLVFYFLSLTNKILIFKLLVSLFSLLILLSISELISYFYNIYRFIVITSFTVSKEYEERLLQAVYVDHKNVDILERDDAKKIIENIEKEKLKTD